jgi:hypothetical protein
MRCPSLPMLLAVKPQSSSYIRLPWGLQKKGLEGVASRLSRSQSDVSDACNAATLIGDHHEWVRFAADRLSVPGDVLWQGMCAEWSLRCISETDRNKLGDAILGTIVQYGRSRQLEKPQIPVQTHMFSKVTHWRVALARPQPNQRSIRTVPESR